MPPPPSITCMLYGTKADGEASEVGVAVRVRGPIRRTIGLQGDQLVVISPKTWPGEWDRTKAFRIVFGDDTASPDPGHGTLTLGGYMVRRYRAMNWGHEFPPTLPPPPPPPAPSVHHEVEVIFETVPGLWRDGRGGLIQIGTVNRLGPDGRVDTAHPDYMTNQELVDALLDDLNFAHDAAPAGLNTARDSATVPTALTAPGPMDWGNARAVPELDALLARLGWAAVFYNDGSKVKVVRLARAGESFTPSSLIDDHAEAYALDVSEAVRPSTIVVTSGRTRSTCISERNLVEDLAAEIPLVWARFDEATGEWVDEDAATQLAVFQAGPVDEDGTTREFAKAFTAVRLDEDEREAFSSFVTIPEVPESAGFGAFGRAPCMVWMRGAAMEAGSQLVNVPTLLADDPVRVDGAQAIAGEGVFILPTSLRAVRMPAGRGGHADADHLSEDDLTVRFAHELDTGDQLLDYYISGWTVVVDDSDPDDHYLTISEDPIEYVDLLLALADPTVVKVEAPFLRRIMVWEPGEEANSDPVAGDIVPTPTNDVALHAAARQIALARAAASMARTGTIVLRGLHDVEPGDEGGSVSAVSWVFEDGWMTILTINQHEVPASFWDELEYEAGRSIAAGLDRLTPGGSSVALAEVRAGSTPGDLAGVYGGGGGAAKAPESKSGGRGRERAVVEAPSKSAAPAPGGSMPSRAEASWLDAIITGSSGGSGNKWSYAWEEAAWNGTTMAAVVGGKNSGDHGVARNLVEYGNDGSGVEAPGWDTEDATLPATIQPISAGTVVRLVLRSFSGDPTWFFECPNAVSFTAPPGAAAIRRIKAKITTSALIDGQDHGWLYDFVQQEHNGDTGWVDKVGGLTSSDALACEFTADATTNKIDPDEDLSLVPDGFACQVSTTDTLPAPLAAATDYFGRWTTEGAGPYTLYPTRDDAIANTNAIDISSAGSGTHTITLDIGGKARNLNEHSYGPTPPTYFSPGIELATIPPGFDMVPIRGEPVVDLEGPYTEVYDDKTVFRWYFRAENAVDGECEVPE